MHKVPFNQDVRQATTVANYISSVRPPKKVQQALLKLAKRETQSVESLWPKLTSTQREKLVSLFNKSITTPPEGCSVGSAEETPTQEEVTAA